MYRFGGDTRYVFAVNSFHKGDGKASFFPEEDADLFHKYSFSQMYLKNQEVKIKSKRILVFDFLLFNLKNYAAYQSVLYSDRSRHCPFSISWKGRENRFFCSERSERSRECK